MSHGLFFDGITKKEIPTDSIHVVWSRPGVDIEYKIIDVNCGDHQKELLIRYGGGGTLGEYYSNQIFRYDGKQKIMKQIFAASISGFSWEHAKEVLDEVNYIDVNDRNGPCVESVSVTPGRFRKKQKAYSLDILPDRKFKTEVYNFNKLTNNFELSL